jgi:hypothetical protein
MVDDINLTLETKEKFVRNQRVQLPMVIGFVFNLVVWAFLWWKIRPQADPVYLHYNIYFGVDLIGQWYRIFLLPALGFVFYVIDIAIAAFLYKKSVLLGYVVLWLAVSLQAVLFFASYLIVRQNL